MATFAKIGIVLVLVFGAFFLSRDYLARAAFADAHLPGLALVLDSKDAALAMNIGDYYFGGGAYNLPRAEVAYRKALAIQPQILWADYQLARIAFVNSDFETALERINAEINAHPENLRALYIRGLIYGYRNKFGDLQQAERDFERFIAFAPTEWAGYNDLAWILFQEEKSAVAKTYLTQALREVPNADQNPWLLNSLGLASLTLGDLSAATDYLERASARASALTAAEFRAAYPGNDAAAAVEGLAQFRAAIAENLSRAHAAQHSGT